MFPPFLKYDNREKARTISHHVTWNILNGPGLWTLSF